MEEARVALVMGAMSSIGTAICRRLAREGLTIAAAYGAADETPQAWLAAQRDDGFRFDTVRVDAGDYGDVEWMVQKVLAEKGRLDVLVNHAAVIGDCVLQKMSADAWHQALRANLDSVFNASKQVIEPMSTRRWGRIINIASISAQSGAFAQCNYAAATAGIHGFSKSLALEVARFGITVNTVSPGFLRTSLVEKLHPDVLESVILPTIPVGRLGEPDELAGLVAYLVSDAAAFVTGANIAINGGQHMC